MSSAHDLNLLLGRLVAHYKVLTKDAVTQALQAWRQTGQPDFGAYLVETGQVAPEVLQKLERARAQYLEKQGVSPAAPAPPPSPAPAVPAPPVASPAPPSPPAATQPPSMPAPAPAVAPAPAPTVAAPTSSAPPAAAGDGPLGYTASSTLRELLQRAHSLGASDLHLHSHAPLRLRLLGRLQDAGPAIEPSRAEELIHELLDETLRTLLDEKRQLDFSYQIPGVARFRANAYHQQRGVDAVFRIIPFDVPDLAQLGLPEDLDRVVKYHQGIVLFTGPAGCGKSSTMAAMVRKINEERPDHIITVEDPIEYAHPSAQCVVNQRQVGPHTESFARALRAALREDPDVIAIGELRDLETISLALTAAETGHLVLGTLHTSNAIRTINRLLGVFPPDQQNQIRTMVSESVRAVVSQRLVARADGNGRVPALEVLVNNRAVGNLIRENKTFQIHSLMQTGAGQGMQLLDASLQELVTQRVIDKAEALRHAEDKKRFE
ncbi:MAG: type IV pilus twitching motility protein PilT [Acidobacteriota bacterium]